MINMITEEEFWISVFWGLLIGSAVGAILLDYIKTGSFL